MHSGLKQIVKEVLHTADIGSELAMEIGCKVLTQHRERPRTSVGRLDPSVEHLTEPFLARVLRDVVRPHTIPSTLQFPRVVFMRSDDEHAFDRKDTVPLPSAQPLGLVQEKRTRTGNPRPRAIFRQVDVRRGGKRTADCEEVGRLPTPLVPENLQGRSATMKLLEIHRNIDDREFRPFLVSQLTKRIPKEVPAKIRRPRSGHTSSHFLLNTA
jgi:hypothetical protein